MSKKLVKCRYKKPEFIYLDERVGNGGIIVSNHDGTDSPMSLEIYLDVPLRFWGAHEMNSGLIKMYKYQTRVFYHEKKHWNLHLARLFCLLATPLTNLFYKGLNLISTYRDARFIKTINEGIETLKKGDNIVIFPEDSTKGYLAEMERFYAGFVVLCEVAYKKGMDVPIYPAYYKKSEKKYYFDAPIYFSTYKTNGITREDIADDLRKRCNALGKIESKQI